MTESSLNVRVSIIMNICKCLAIVIVVLLCTVIMPVHADVVHKWIDDNGVTHYSDQLPKDNPKATDLISISNVYSNSGQKDYRDDYYSITNQWARMRKERIERKQLQLDMNQQKAAQQSVSPQIVYINQAEEDRPRSMYAPLYLGRSKYENYKKYHHYNAGKNYSNRYSNRFNNRYSGSTCKLPQNTFSKYKGSSLSLTFR